MVRCTEATIYEFPQLTPRTRTTLASVGFTVTTMTTIEIATQVTTVTTGVRIGSSSTTSFQPRRTR